MVMVNLLSKADEDVELKFDSVEEAADFLERLNSVLSFKQGRRWIYPLTSKNLADGEPFAEQAN